MAAGELNPKMLLPVVVVVAGFDSVSFVSGGLVDEAILDPKLKTGAGVDVEKTLLVEGKEVRLVVEDELPLKRLFVVVLKAGKGDEEENVDGVEAGVPLVILESLEPNEKIPVDDDVVGLADCKDSVLLKMFTDFGALPLSSLLGAENCT